jgi:hypothetical protein
LLFLQGIVISDPDTYNSNASTTAALLLLLLLLLSTGIRQ